MDRRGKKLFFLTLWITSRRRGETQEQIDNIYLFLSLSLSLTLTLYLPLSLSHTHTLKKAKLAAQMLTPELCWHRLEEICDLMS